eukprot:TRINITY_DN2497_c0_g1_i1.p1 TRINITY_DN2497_c0_g1~~TRINITY_DN2497_c0_g1_i1.p1  ORF type:complete len:473 (-),score=105.59 TRINITY_DN2497_c0_g1_i1:120-1538(-)
MKSKHSEGSDASTKHKAHKSDETHEKDLSDLKAKAASVQEEKKPRLVPIFSKSYHKPAMSLLEPENTAVFHYRGLMNLSFLVLFLVHFRLIIANWINYGLLINPSHITYFLEDPTAFPASCIFLSLGVFIVFACFIEKAISANKVSENAGMSLHTVNTILALIIPNAAVWFLQPNPFSGCVLTSYSIILFLKLTSYGLVNMECRILKKHASSGDSKKEEKPGMVVYPENVYLGDIFYFMMAPTLSYDLNFPRAESIRWKVVFKKLGELCLVLAIQLVIVEQYMVPTVRNAMKPITERETDRMLERLLKLAIPNLYVWLLMFYGYFHLYLNIFAELLRFADRNFYNDWWNSTHVDQFWRNWNIPVHIWMVKHIWIPSQHYKLNKTGMVVVIFFISAVFHELMVSVPFHTLNFWAFGAMMMQVPFSFMTKFLENHTTGNIVFWLSIILGQPFAILAYAVDFYGKTVPNTAAHID